MSPSPPGVGRAGRRLTPYRGEDFAQMGVEQMELDFMAFLAQGTSRTSFGRREGALTCLSESPQRVEPGRLGKQRSVAFEWGKGPRLVFALRSIRAGFSRDSVSEFVHIYVLSFVRRVV